MKSHIKQSYTIIHTHTHHIQNAIQQYENMHNHKQNIKTIYTIICETITNHTIIDTHIHIIRKHTQIIHSYTNHIHDHVNKPYNNLTINIQTTYQLIHNS